MIRSYNAVELLNSNQTKFIVEAFPDRGCFTFTDCENKIIYNGLIKCISTSQLVLKNKDHIIIQPSNVLGLTCMYSDEETTKEINELLNMICTLKTFMFSSRDALRVIEEQKYNDNIKMHNNTYRLSVSNLELRESIIKMTIKNSTLDKKFKKFKSNRPYEHSFEHWCEHIYDGKPIDTFSITCPDTAFQLDLNHLNIFTVGGK